LIGEETGAFMTNKISEIIRQTSTNRSVSQTRALVGIVAALALSTLAAAEPPLEARFKELDKNGDGKVTREEAPDRWPVAKRLVGCVPKKACHSERSLRSEESPISSFRATNEVRPPASASATGPPLKSDTEINGFYAH
jgi:hypothetical protein